MTSESDRPKSSVPVVIIMGVAGSGKSTIGTLLAETLGWQFIDADRFHPAASIEKMKSGMPLDDADRMPWLEALRAAIFNWLSENKRAVLACSALKASYRAILTVDHERIRFVYLKGDAQLLAGRLRQRHGHFMKADMLESQLKTLEVPEDALAIDASKRPPEIVAAIIEQLKLS